MDSNQDDLKTHICPICKDEFCVNGCADVHSGLSCASYQTLIQKEGKAFYSILRKDHIKTCGKCGAWIEKTKGCNHITCKCKHEFCYLCGIEWKNCDCDQFGDDFDDSSDSEIGHYSDSSDDFNFPIIRQRVRVFNHSDSSSSD